MMRLLSLTLICLMVLTASFARPAQAQVFGDAAAFAPAKFGENNPHLKALLQLQYQMQILKRLIEHELAVNAMLKSSVDIGVIDPMIPKPDQELCQQIPANIPCAQAYKGMYADFSVEKEVADVPPPSATPMTGNSTVPSIAENALTPLPGDGLAANGATLYWADVTCMNDKCSAIITPDPADPRARYRVTTGEKLLDGAVVSAISANGVTINNGNASVVLDPAPKA